MAAYEALDISELELESNRVNSKGQNGENNSYVRYPDANSFVTLRLLPRRKGEPLFLAVKYHMLRDNNGNKKIFFSPKQLVKTDKGPKWVGDNTVIDKYLRDLWAKSDKVTGKAQDDFRNQYRELKGIERYYYNVIVRQEKDPKTGETLKNTGPKIFSCGKTIHAMIVRAIVGDKDAGEEALGDVTNPKSGRDFKLVKKMNGEYPNYDLSKFLDASPLGDADEINTWLESLHDLQAIRVVKSEDDIKHALKVHLGLVEEAANDDDGYDPSEFTSKPSSKTSSKPTSSADLGLETASSTAVEEEVMADDEFLKEIDDL
jgi:gp32 DNA binding protein like